MAEVWLSEGHSEKVAEDVEPAKMLLGLLALDLGLQGVAREKKRVIQFGGQNSKDENREG